MDFNIAAERAYPVPFVNSTLLPMLLLSLAKQKHSPDTAKEISREYDYIVGKYKCMMKSMFLNSTLLKKGNENSSILTHFL